MATKELTIIGAGPAGLAAAYYAKKAGITFRLLEGSGRVGGNAATLRHGHFLYDTGAHRWHDRLPEITAQIKELLGEDLVEIHVPSQIYSKGRFFDFPLSPLNLLQNLSFATLLKAVAEVFAQQIKPELRNKNFKTSAIAAYGPTIANRFLLGYSEKLWGAPVEKLSVAVAGKRLKGLNLKTFLIEAMRGSKAKTQHLDGGFYYPKYGIGAIADKLAAQIGQEQIQLNARVQKIHHHNNEITAVETETKEKQTVHQLISTLPLTTLVRSLNPPAPAHILAAAAALEFRHLVLVVLFLNKPCVTPNASVYFPDPEVPFTRLYEPRNRSAFMAPEGKTSVVIEIPVSRQDFLWQQTDEKLIELVQQKLTGFKLISPEEVIYGKVHKVPFAYPVLLQESEQHTQVLLHYLASFSNLKLIGRTASFRYTHLHDHFLQAKQIISNL